MANTPLSCLVVLDGFGTNPETNGNAILSTPTPNLDYLWNNYPHTLLKAAEEEVGLNFGEMGNSEVGHLIIGAGRVLYQSLPRINASLQDQSFYQNATFTTAINHVQSHDSALHIMGMVSVAGVHAHLNHFLALLNLASRNHLKKVYLHIILDGRDSGPKDAPIFLAKINEAIKKYNTGSIATIHGRAYAMDRNQNWERIQLSYNALIGVSGPTNQDPLACIQQNYSNGSDDENLLPTIITNSNNQPLGPLSSNDAFIFTNYREDRARQFIQFLTQIPPAPSDNGNHPAPMPQITPPANLKIITMTEYDKNISSVLAAYPPEYPTNTLSDQLHNLGIHQTHISETEKYAHVTYFFNGGRETPHPDETFIQVPSPKPETFVTQPQMAAQQVTQKTLETITNHPNEFLVVNFANCDMIGHTGDFEATRKAISIIDQYIGQLAQTVISHNGYFFLTADHGNAESKIDPTTGSATKDHTSNPVPFIAVGPNLKLPQPTQDRITTNSTITGILADVAPTILTLLNLPIPNEMTGTPLFSIPEMPAPQP